MEASRRGAMEAKLLPLGPVRDAAIRVARQAETAARSTTGLTLPDYSRRSKAAQLAASASSCLFPLRSRATSGPALLRKASSASSSASFASSLAFSVEMFVLNLETDRRRCMTPPRSSQVPGCDRMQIVKRPRLGAKVAKTVSCSVLGRCAQPTQLALLWFLLSKGGRKPPRDLSPQPSGVRRRRYLAGGFSLAHPLRLRNDAVS
jgi:hypothetical protein